MPFIGTRCLGSKPRWKAKATVSRPSFQTWSTSLEPWEDLQPVSTFIKNSIISQVFVDFYSSSCFSDPTKFFGCELGAQTQFDHKNDRYIVNGSHEAAKLQDMLDIFIRKFVLCEACDNPETVLKVNNKRGILSASCKACGHLFQLDMRHKLTTFILKVCLSQKLEFWILRKKNSSLRKEFKCKQSFTIFFHVSYRILRKLRFKPRPRV